MEYPQGLNIVASITEPGIRSRIPLIWEEEKEDWIGLFKLEICLMIISLVFCNLIEDNVGSVFFLITHQALFVPKSFHL